MAERKKGPPWCAVTWVTGVMSDEDKCRYAVWFKARYAYKKIEDDTFDAVSWRAQHKLLRDTRIEELRAEGWEIRTEMDWKVRGHSGTILGGRPDVVALDHKRQVIRVVEAKSGKRKDKYWWQVGLYMRWIRKMLGGEYTSYLVEGELLYGGEEPGTIMVLWDELTPDVLMIMNRELQALGLGLAPEKTPSEMECLYCPIPKSECPEKMAERVLVEDDSF